MKKISIACLALSSLLISLTGPAQAQGPGLTRQQVITETELFLAVHDWDPLNSVWTEKPGFDLPKVLALREAASALREQFLALNTWNDSLGTWAPVQGAPRLVNQIISAQMQMETDRFMLTHRFEEGSSKWVSRSRPAA
ncbi:RNA-binding protein [Roseateles oligotrophus]|uniref:Uncharacterized protein n=1 Tax=Roseateles oligotrophus TaxID=1769250 RepID=A0ABT2YC89_9BURK|nr:hypothetical protein [Roseateles oligotrophus]MCV2367647.1 hypothetical protein [Roseateles oligotrophus]